MSTVVEETPLFAEIAGEDGERVMALIADPIPPPSSAELLARHPSTTKRQDAAPSLTNSSHG